jgi:hypothetical protein
MLDAIGIITKHLIVLIVMLGSIWLLERYQLRLWPPDGLLFFHSTPYEFKAQWLFDAGDISSIVGFLAKGTWALLTQQERTQGA